MVRASGGCGHLCKLRSKRSSRRKMDAWQRGNWTRMCLVSLLRCRPVQQVLRRRPQQGRSGAAVGGRAAAGVADCWADRRFLRAARGAGDHCRPVGCQAGGGSHWRAGGQGCCVAVRSGAAGRGGGGRARSANGAAAACQGAVCAQRGGSRASAGRGSAGAGRRACQGAFQHKCGGRRACTSCAS